MPLARDHKQVTRPLGTSVSTLRHGRGSWAPPPMPTSQSLRVDRSHHWERRGLLGRGIASTLPEGDSPASAISWHSQ